MGSPVTASTRERVTAPCAVLFDMDGTLVETEEYWGEALHDLARRRGGELSAAARGATVGTSMRTAMGVLYADLGLPPAESALEADARWVEDRVAGLMAAGVRWRPGARELLAAVRTAGVPTALVTTTNRRLTDLVLASVARSFGGRLPFDVTVCGDEVPARKPDPAPYRQAAGALGVDVRCCVVVEDSAVGVAAGLASGAAVLGVPAMQTLDPAPGLVLRETLAGLGLAELAAMLAPAGLACRCG
ncbi:HAD family hydrolase [Trujillonella endophytica]|uniref:Haloacid dehalogenase superfamily, subfamily IA, variant 3 with third motif having DD or ED n=1 Tax=Trujillonella endophytica TaxID=673521 RepID=A0A1H8T2J4_9ACTN|nr:HAD family phosphatase [Trujillella endophytica]SEO85210.1 haloacid dehalogenase superfamily, subfamily IA, variant 3 with third motif having DD or ED [Trujillella endophytica]